VAVSFIGEGNGGSEENHRPAASDLKSGSHNAIVPEWDRVELPHVRDSNLSGDPATIRSRSRWLIVSQ
jgi:hypothetical protein